jgi:hypothetical protein
MIRICFRNLAPYTASKRAVYGFRRICDVKSKRQVGGNFQVARSKRKSSHEAKQKPNWSYWASKEFWSVDETAALMAGAEPTTVLEESDLVQEAFNEFRDIVGSWDLLDKIIMPLRPIQLIEFLDHQRLTIAPQLRRAVLEYEGNPVVAYRLLSERIVALEKENRELKLQAALDPRERKTLMSLVCGLVQRHYRYDPAKRSNVVREIQAQLRELKINLSDDAIRRTLNASYELLPQHLIE